MKLSVISVKNEDLEKAREVKAIIDKEYSRHLTIDMLVNRVNTNKFKIKIAFKAITNCTVHEYLTKVRVDHAKELLENTYYTIEGIAYKIGLDKSNLDKQFKKLTRKTPTQWRNIFGKNSVLFLSDKKTKVSYRFWQSPGMLELVSKQNNTISP